MGLNEPSPLRTLQSAVGAEIVIDGRRYINFGGSAYLGLAARPHILQAGVEALSECGSGAPLARFHRVFTRPHQEVESEASAFFKSAAAMYIAGGYYFGLVALAATAKRFDVIYFDEHAHFSLREAIAASGLESHSFRHLDPQDLRDQLLSQAGRRRPLVVTDGTFSTLGEIAPLDALADCIAPYDGKLLVDESHSFGVLGPNGRGAVEHHGLHGGSVLFGGSLGKAFGTCGGIIPASVDEVAEMRLTPTGRGASAGLAAAAAMCARSLQFVREHPELLRQLRANVSYLKSGLRKLGLAVDCSDVPIAAFAVGTQEQDLRRLRDCLQEEGIFVYHSRYIGAGPAGVLRCGIFADHTAEHMDALLQALARML